MNLTSLRFRIANINTSPSNAQKREGNYKKGHITLHGINISIENPRGSTRTGISNNGIRWTSTLPDRYGYIKKTTGADGDHVDCYIGPDFTARKIFVIDQKHHHTDKFDEHKCMINYDSIENAVKAYRAAFSDKKDRVLAVTVMTIRKFKDWLKNYDTTKLVNYFSGKRK